MKKIIEIDLEKLTEHGLSADLYCILYCIYYKDSHTLIKYLNSVGKPPISSYDKLSDLGFIMPLEKEKPTIESIILTDKFTNLFVSKEALQDFNKLFEELIETYPKKVGNRRLHTEKDNCKLLYKKLLVKANKIDTELHKTIIEALKKEIQERSLSGNLGYMVQLPRYIRSKGWEVYLDDSSDDFRPSFKKVL